MLLLIYKDKALIQQIVNDPQTAQIPDIHKAVFKFAERFTRHSWLTTEDDIQSLRAIGLEDQEIALWASRAAGQTWFVMSADGGGVSLDQGKERGHAVGQKRQDYHTNTEVCTSSLGKVQVNNAAPASGVCWIATDEKQDKFVQVSQRASSRYGFTPNVIRALSLRSETMHRNELALRLLESPQSGDLSARHHAMVRARVAHLNSSDYSRATIMALLNRVGEVDNFEAITTDEHEHKGQDKVVLDFASKIANHAYKVTEKDAQSFRDNGLSDKAYVDVLNTTALQTSIDRLANTLGVKPDSKPVIASADE